MCKPTAIAFVVMIVLAVFSAIAFAAPFAGTLQAERGADIPVCRSAQLNQPTEDTTTRVLHTAVQTTHDNAPRQAGRRTAQRVDAEPQADERNGNPLPGAMRFATITVTIDPQGIALAAYQFEITAGHSFTVVGLDNAGHPVFSDPPHYDRSAAARGTDRLIVADYSTLPVEQLLAKPQAAATIHAAFAVDDATDLDALAASVALTLTAAADADGNRIDAVITYQLHLAERPGQE